MLVLGHSKFSLDREWTMVLKIMPAFDNTFVLLVINKSGFGELITHVNAEGKQLFTYEAKDTINFFTMFNDSIAAYCDVQESKIILVDLKRKQISSINHNFMSSCTAAVNIDYFTETRLIVLIERGQYNQHRLKLSYLSGDPQDQPFETYETQEGEFSHTDMITKGNSHSMIIWAHNSFQETIQFRIFHLKLDRCEQGKREPLHFKIKNIMTHGLLNSLVNIWQGSSDNFILVSNSHPQKTDKHTAPNTNYVYNSKTAILRPTGFSFQGLDNERLIDQQNIGKYSIFPTFEYKAGAALTSAVHLVDNEQEKQVQVGKISWKCNSEYRWHNVHYELNSILLSQCLPGDVKEIEINHFVVLSPKDTWIHLLLHACEDFDDDLLQEAVQLLDER